MRPEVSVFVAVYNHKEYIAQALDSILKQKVTFSYEVVVHDDASTDGTAEILRSYEKRYPEIIKGVYETVNQKGFANLDCLFSLCSAEYCALLDGDDFWSDEQKLQRQYDYMTAHPECVLYMHNAWKLDVLTGEKRLLNTFPASGSYELREHVLCGLGSKFPALGSYFFRMNRLRGCYPRFAIETGVADYPMRVMLATQGSVYYDERPMSVYRYLTNGSFMKNIRDHLNAYVDYTLKMCAFYKKFNEYLEYRFDDIYEKKIDSDIWGLAAATCDHREMIPDIGENWLRERLNDCFDLLEGNGWIEAVKDRSSSDETIWIYGTSRLGACCKHSLEKNGLCVKGFVVSDGYSKPDTFEGCEVKYLSETAGQNAFYVVAAQPINQDSIEQVLLANGEKRYCFPYQMMKKDD